MQNIVFGQTIKELRSQRGLSQEELSKKLGMHWTYLSKVENGFKRPNLDFLRNVKEKLSLTEEQFQNLRSLLLTLEKRTRSEKASGKKGVNYTMDDKSSQKQDQPILNIKLPENLPVLYSDMIAVTSTAYGITLDIAQKVGATNNHNIVARVGISLDHAKDVLNVLAKEISNAEKFRKKHQEDQKAKNN